MSSENVTTLHFLLIRFSSMGDVILASSAVSFLKKVFGENVKITFLTWDSFESILEDLPVKRLIFSKEQSKRHLKRFYKLIENAHSDDPFSFIWDLQGSWLSYKIRIKMGSIPSLVVDKRKWERFFLIFSKVNLYKTGINHLGSRHHIENLWDDFTPVFLNTCVKFSKNDYFIQNYKIKNQAENNKIIFLPGAAHALKKWPVENFLEVMEKLDKELSESVIFQCIGGINENEVYYLKDRFKSIKNRKCDFINSKDLKYSLETTGNASLVISNDTGLMHHAWINNIAIIAIFGATSEHFGFAPFGENVDVKSKKSLWCRPCSVTGSGRCINPKKLECLKSIKPSDVIASAMELLVK